MHFVEHIDAFKLALFFASASAVDLFPGFAAAAPSIAGDVQVSSSPLLGSLLSSTRISTSISYVHFCTAFEGDKEMSRFKQLLFRICFFLCHMLWSQSRAEGILAVLASESAEHRKEGKSKQSGQSDSIASEESLFLAVMSSTAFLSAV